MIILNQDNIWLRVRTFRVKIHRRKPTARLAYAYKVYTCTYARLAVGFRRC